MIALWKHLKQLFDAFLRASFWLDWKLCNTFAFTNISLHFFKQNFSISFRICWIFFSWDSLWFHVCKNFTNLFPFIQFSFLIFLLKRQIFYLPRNLYQKYFKTLSVNFLFRCLLELCQHSFYFTIFYSRVSVMRGQVITPQGLGIVGIRVSVDKDARFGFTLTRTGGWWVQITFAIQNRDRSRSKLATSGEKTIFVTSLLVVHKLFLIMQQNFH